MTQTQWTVPQPVAGGAGAAPVVARYASLAVGSERTYVLGNDIGPMDGHQIPENPLTAWVLGGRSIGKPAGRFYFVEPKGVVDAKERLHVVWAEPRGGYRRITTDEWPLRELTTIWAATYDPRAGWSAAEKLYDGPELGWWFVGVADGSGVFRAAGQASGARDDRLGVIVSPWTALPQSLVYLRLHQGRWRVLPVTSTVPGGGGYPSVVSDGERVFLAYVAADPEAQRDRNSVFLQRSIDRGKTWGPPQLVSRSGLTPAREVQVLLGHGGAVHLIWLQDVNGQSARGAHRESMVLRHVMSHDGGATWSPADDLGPGASRLALRTAVDRCGVVHAVYENWQDGADKVRLEHATWNGRWSRPQRLFPELSSFSPALRVSTRGGLVMAFLAAPASVPPPKALLQTFSAELVPGR